MKKVFSVLLVSTLTILALSGCQKSTSGLKGAVKIDGSSTVYPISEAVGEEFQKENPGVRVTVGKSGTGGGFEKFVASEIDITDASRTIEDDEKLLASKNGIEYIELEVAYDGLSIVVNKNNNFVKKLTVGELKKIWEPKSKVKNWSDVRKSWPSEAINLYGPGTDSGTFDYFTDVINGEEGASRSDYTASEEDNVLVQGVSQDKNGLGYFGYAYFVENKDKLNLVGVDSGKGAVEPSKETIQSNEYTPLSRPLYIYVSKKSLKKPEVAAFIKYYLEIGKELVADVGYIKAPNKVYEEGLKKIE